MLCMCIAFLDSKQCHFSVRVTIDAGVIATSYQILCAIIHQVLIFIPLIKQLLELHTVCYIGPLYHLWEEPSGRGFEAQQGA